MNPAQEHLAKTVAFNLKAQKGVKASSPDIGPMSGSGASSTKQPTKAISPIQVSSRHKRQRNKGTMDLIGEREKGKYEFPLYWHDKSFFEGSSLYLLRGESLQLEELDLPTKRIKLA